MAVVSEIDPLWKAVRMAANYAARYLGELREVARLRCWRCGALLQAEDVACQNGNVTHAGLCGGRVEYELEAANGL